MMRTATDRKTADRMYAEAVVKELQNKLNIDPTRAGKIFLRYYRATKRTWGYQLNADAFTDKIIDLHSVFSQRRTISGINIGHMLRRSNLKDRKHGVALKSVHIAPSHHFVATALEQEYKVGRRSK